GRQIDSDLIRRPKSPNRVLTRRRHRPVQWPSGTLGWDPFPGHGERLLPISLLPGARNLRATPELHGAKHHRQRQKFVPETAVSQSPFHTSRCQTRTDPYGGLLLCRAPVLETCKSSSPPTILDW